MSYICRACSEIYDDSLGNNYCPKQRCGGDVRDFIWVDSAFAAVVAEFNKKGLEIESAKFGIPVNVVNDAPSIVFRSFLLDEFTEDEFENDIFANLPGDWKFKVKKDFNDYGTGHFDSDSARYRYPMIECIFYGDTNIDRQIKFFDNYLQIAKFARDMDKLNY